MGSASSVIDDSSSGYHILKVQDGSPGQKAGLEAFFDFIVAVGDLKLEQDSSSIKDVLARYKDTPVRLQVYSTKTQQFREVMLTPSSDWGGQGLLGLSIRYCSFKGASENVWHVLNVSPSSPASMAGLQPYTDYIIGTEAMLNDSEDFFSVVETHNGQPLRLYVYNSATDKCREVTLIPNLSWGGSGMLGCEIGFGLLHRIPSPGTATQPAPPNATANQAPQPQSQWQPPQPMQQPIMEPGYTANIPPQIPISSGGPPPLQPAPQYQPPPPAPVPPAATAAQDPASVVQSIDGIPLAPPAPLPSNLFAGIQLTPPSTPPAFEMPSGAPTVAQAAAAAPVAPPPTQQPGVAGEGSAVGQDSVPLVPMFSAQPMQSQFQPMPPPMMPPMQMPIQQQQQQQQQQSMMANVAPPGMPPIAVQMPPADFLTGQPLS